MHKWQHDKTNKGVYVPKDCNGKFVVTVDPEKGELDQCMRCGRANQMHDGETKIDDHSRCWLECTLCGETWKCTELYPRDRRCTGSRIDIHPPIIKIENK